MSASDNTHHSAQEFESSWWGNCVNTFGEEAKQITYANRMGLTNEPKDGKWPVYNLGGKSVVDLGGGPASMLLKCVNVGRATVVDPCPYPKWVRKRYAEAGVEYVRGDAETFDGDGYDECWIYNCLQHVVSPEKVVETARNSASAIRIFEWIEMDTNVGHPHTLHANELNDWLGVNGSVGMVDENGATGLAYWSHP